MVKSATIVIDGFELKSQIDGYAFSHHAKIAIYDTVLSLTPMNFMYELGNREGACYNTIKKRLEETTAVSLGDDIYVYLESALFEDDYSDKECAFLVEISSITARLICNLTAQIMHTFAKIFPNPNNLIGIEDFVFSEERGTDIVYDLVYTDATAH